VRRWSRGGRPRKAPVSMTNGAKNAHSSSLNRPRTKADLHRRDQLRITLPRVGGIPFRRFVHAAESRYFQDPIFCWRSNRLLKWVRALPGFGWAGCFCIPGVVCGGPCGLDLAPVHCFWTESGCHAAAASSLGNRTKL
jgi:hypothetical protein